jgi:hypothetical protein
VDGELSRSRSGRISAQLPGAGIAVTIDAEAYPNGRFARLYDPEGNPIELWEPNGRDAPRPPEQTLERAGAS